MANWYDYIPVAGPIAEAAQGNWKQAGLDWAGKPYYDAVKGGAKGIYGSTQVPGQPGVGAGPPANPAQFIRDPTTGMYYDPTSGKTYTDAAGTQLVTNPNVAQQVAQNIQRANSLFTSSTQGQNQLIGDLNNVINGSAPSVAQNQLGQGVDNIAKSANAMAAGHTGENAALAHIQAMRSAADAQAKANQDAAMLRAQETAQARAQLGNVLGQQQDTGLGYAKTGESGQEAQQGLNEKSDEKNAETNKGLIDQGAHVLGALLA
jgi:hypothetical protein